MRHIKLGESTVMQEFEKIAAERGWTTQSNVRTAQDEMPPEHIPTGLVKKPHEIPADVEPKSTMEDIDKMLAQVKPAEPPQQTTYHGQLVQDVQKALMDAGEDVGLPYGPDGRWGWFTAKAWNAFAKKNPQAGLPQATEKQPPSNELMRKMLGAAPAGGTFPAVPEHIPTHLVKEPHMTQPWQYPAGPELAPKASLAIAAAHMAELVALANDLDEMGEPKVAEAIDEQLRMYKEAVDKLYDITGETGEQLVGEAHPGGGPTMAPAKEEGGKVETIVEEQKKIMKVVQKQPTGKQAAFVARQLVALANRLDAEGKTEAALLVDKTLAELGEGPQRPFVGSGLRREAVAFIPFLIWGLVAAIAATGTVAAAKHLSSKSDGVKTDSNDLLKVSEDLAKEFPTNKELRAAHDALRGMLGPLASELSDAVPQSGSKEEVGRYVAAMYAFEKALPDIQAAVESVKAAVPTGRFQGKLSLDEHLADLIAGFEKNRTSVEAFAKRGRAMGKTPAPEAAKEEPAYEKRLRDTLKTSHARFLGTVDKLLNGLVKALQDPAKEAEANRMLKGKLSETIDWLKALRKQKAPATLAERNTLNGYNNILWNGYLGPLRRNPKLADVFAAAKSDRLVREAAPSPQPGIPGAPVGPLGQPTTPTKKAPGGKPTRRPVEKRDDIGQLQQALVALDMGPVSKNGTIDKAWGPYTATAWQKLNARVKGRLGAFGPRNAPPPEAVRRALQLANVLQQFSQSIEVAPGVTLPAGAFASAQAFLRALAARRAAGIDTSGNLDTAANRKRALEILRAFAEGMENEDVQIDLAAKLGEQGMRRLSQQVNILLDTLGAAEAGIPSYRKQEGPYGQAPGYGGRQPYGQEGGRQPYGRGEGSIGEFGTLESGRGRGGRGDQRTPPGMSLQDRIYNIPDVSGFVNDPTQFAFWAQRYWMRVSPRETEKDPYTVAHKVIDHLRRQIAVLQDALMRAPVRNREELQTTLRQRHEALNDMYTVLPKGR